MDVSLNVMREGGQRQMPRVQSGGARGLRPKEVPVLELERLRDREEEDNAVVTVPVSNLPSAVSWGTAASGRPPQSSPTYFAMKLDGGLEDAVEKNDLPLGHQDSPGSYRCQSASRHASNQSLKMESPQLTPHSTPKLIHTQTKPVHTRSRKLEAEELTEERKKQAVIEQVMVDQLSRAVISDPEQNAIKNSTVPQRRTLHHTVVKTDSSLTENLLSQKLYFHARILSRCGREACRELIGFYFTCDQTLTVYEYRNFGKNRCSALPFITRGVYRTRERPYCLADISQGADLRFTTNGPHLPESLRRRPYLTLRVTLVDEETKRSLLMLPSYRAQCGEPQRCIFEEEASDQKTIRRIQGAVRNRLRGRAVRSLMGLGRRLKSLDLKENGLVGKDKLRMCLMEVLGLNQEDIEAVWRILGQQGEPLVDYADVMRAVTGEMSEIRKAVFLKVYAKLDPNKTGSVSMTDIEKFCSAKQYLHTEHGPKSDFLTCVLDTERVTTDVSYAEFEDYHEGLSIEIPCDEEYINILRSTWSI